MVLTQPWSSLVTGFALLGISCSSDAVAPPVPGGTSDGTGGSLAQGETTARGGAFGAGGASSAAGDSGPGGAPHQLGGAPSATGGKGDTGGTSNNPGTRTAPTGGTQSGSNSASSAGGSSAAGGSAAGGSAASKSAGCGKTRTLQNGTLNITFNNASRKYILRVPDNYVSTHPYRLVFAFAESGASASSVASKNYFTMATLDTDKTTIFVAPDAANGQGSWSKSDVELTGAILTELEGDLCIDTSRIFATGFSFGGAMSLAIACQRADVFRGVAFFSGADLTGSCTNTLTKPIAYYASQASQDSTGDPLPTSGRVKQAQFAAVNGCTAEPTATTFPTAGQAHRCTFYKNCSAGHPTEYCVFDGPHGWEPKDPGQSTSWNAQEAWKFITQF